ncbi:MAG: ABC transporter permease [Phycisphaerae bacterium]|nr:ABC transporter permease [Phycisphaerae bacterium]
MIFRRLALLPVILLVIYTVTLTLVWLVPGDPLEKSEGRRPPAEVIAAMQRQYNLDSFPAFYGSYLANATGWSWLRDTLTGDARLQAEAAVAAGRAPPVRRVFDLGPSFQYDDRRVNEIIASGLPVSMTIGAAAIVLALFIGLAAGLVAAARPGSWLDVASLAVSLIGISLPSFVIGTAVLLVFPVALGWGRIGAWGGITDVLWPALTLSLPYAAYIARLTRMGMLEVLSSDYIRTARAKGAGEARVLLRHALKNAFLPVLSYLGPAAAGAMTGSFVVEKVFNVPGLGQHFVNAVLNADRFLIIGVVLVYATLLILFNLAVDVLYRWADPRIE